jgi:predicted nucleotidyltransferase
MVIITTIKVIKMGLLNFLNASETARKVFGKRELKIIEKQLRGINLTQSEKNRLSRDIRKKFEFIKEASRFSDEFGLKKAADIKKIIEDSKKIMMGDILFYKIEEIVLYGSAAEKKMTFRSDIDIAVKFKKTTLSEATMFRKRILGKADSRVDIQVYNLLPQKIKNQVDKGKILYKK